MQLIKPHCIYTIEETWIPLPVFETIHEFPVGIRKCGLNEQIVIKREYRDLRVFSMQIANAIDVVDFLSLRCSEPILQSCKDDFTKSIECSCFFGLKFRNLFIPGCDIRR